MGYLADHAQTRVAVPRQRSNPGFEYFNFFQDACARGGLQITYLETIGQTDSDLRPLMKRVREANADALVYWGFGVPAVGISTILEEEG